MLCGNLRDSGQFLSIHWLLLLLSIGWQTFISLRGCRRRLRSLGVRRRRSHRHIQHIAAAAAADAAVFGRRQRRIAGNGCTGAGCRFHFGLMLGGDFGAQLGRHGLGERRLDDERLAIATAGGRRRMGRQMRRHGRRYRRRQVTAVAAAAARLARCCGRCRRRHGNAIVRG